MTAAVVTPEVEPQRLADGDAVDHAPARRPGRGAKTTVLRQPPDTDAVVTLFERHLGDRAKPCLREIALTLPRRPITIRRLTYMQEIPPKASASDVFSSIVSKHDTARTLLPSLRDLFEGTPKFVIPRTLGRSSLAGTIPPQTKFSITDYLTPSTDTAIAQLWELTDRMNLLGLDCLLPEELPLAVTLYHARVSSLHQPTLAKLWEIFEMVLVKAQKARILKRATITHRGDVNAVISKADVEKLNDLTKVERDLMGEIGGSPRAAKRLGFGSTDALSALIDAARTPANGAAPSFTYDAEAIRARLVAAREASVGQAVHDPDAEAMPEAEIEQALQETVDALGTDL